MIPLDTGTTQIRTLYLIETEAKNESVCSACDALILRGTAHFRHDPHPYARLYRGQTVRHYCRDCILGSNPGPKDLITKRIRIPAKSVHTNSSGKVVVEDELLSPQRIEIIGVGQLLAQRLRVDPTLLHHLTPHEFEEFICERLFTMGMEPMRVGAANHKDGGIDIVFWPRLRGAFPFLGAAQVKHQRNPATREGPKTVRDFAGAISGQPFNAGIIVTNTSFTPDAQWYARERANLIRLRDLQDIQRWISNNFGDDAEWREMPKYLEFCPGVVIKLRD